MTTTNTDSDQETQAPKTLEVLSCTAEFYIATQGRNITAYNVKHLKITYSDYLRQSERLNPVKELKEKARGLGCEVVTDVRQLDTICGSYCILGTGLILKTEAP